MYILLLTFRDTIDCVNLPRHSNTWTSLPSNFPAGLLYTWDSSFLNVNTSHIGTFIVKSTYCACRPLRMADLPSMCDEVHMEWIHPLLRRHFCEKCMSYISAHFRS